MFLWLFGFDFGLVWASEVFLCGLVEHIYYRGYFVCVCLLGLRVGSLVVGCV